MSEKSRHIGYKKCRGGRIVVLEILGEHNEERENVVDKRFAEMRCSKARVMRIYDMHDTSIEYEEAFSIYDKSFRYEVGKVVRQKGPFRKDLEVVRRPGIRYFLCEEPAHAWRYTPHNGLSKSWYNNGSISTRYTYKDGKLDGLCESFHCNDQMYVCTTYKNGKKNGMYEKWYKNGQIENRCTYKDGKMNGMYELWYNSGQLAKRCTYKDGKKDGLSIIWYENGRMHARCTFKNGNPNGLYELWNEDGSVNEELTRVY